MYRELRGLGRGQLLACLYELFVALFKSSLLLFPFLNVEQCPVEDCVDNTGPSLEEFLPVHIIHRIIFLRLLGIFVEIPAVYLVTAKKQNHLAHLIMVLELLAVLKGGV